MKNKKINILSLEDDHKLLEQSVNRNLNKIKLILMNDKISIDERLKYTHKIESISDKYMESD